jgi:hypothetical protein
MKTKKGMETSPLKWSASPSISPSREGAPTDYSPMLGPDKIGSPMMINKRNNDDKNLMTDEMALKKILFQVDQNFENEDKKENKKIIRIISK